MSRCVGERHSHAQTDVPPDCVAALIAHKLSGENIKETLPHILQQPRDILALIPRSAALHEFAPGNMRHSTPTQERGNTQEWDVGVAGLADAGGREQPHHDHRVHVARVVEKAQLPRPTPCACRMIKPWPGRSGSVPRTLAGG